MEIYNKNGIKIISENEQFFTKNYDDTYIKGGYSIYDNNEFIVSFKYIRDNGSLRPSSIEEAYNIYSSLKFEDLLTFLNTKYIFDHLVTGFRNILRKANVPKLQIKFIA